MDGTVDKRVATAAKYYTPKEIVAGFEEATEKKVELDLISWEQFRESLPPSCGR
jgi:hypothetical protein